MFCPEEELRMMALLDGELPAEEARSVEEHLRTCSRCTDELRSFEEVIGLTKKARLAEPSDVEWERFQDGLYGRIERRSGWAFLAAGLVILLGFALYEIAVEPPIPTPVRVGAFLVVLGFLLLAVSVARGRWRAFRRDRYRHVKR